jgi:L-malate glycosyltransferase
VRIDQVVPDLAPRDAVGAHMLNVQNLLRSHGIDSEIFYESAAPELRHLGRPIDAIFEPVADRTFLFQLAIGSPGFEMMWRVDDPFILNYHNITPASLIGEWEPEIAAGLAYGRHQLAELAEHCTLGLGVTRYNELELIDLGYAPTGVAPLLIDMRHQGREPDRALLDRLASQDGPLLLYVGKIAPHKAPHDLVAMLAVLRELYHPNARLALVGTPLGTTYIEALAAYIDSCNLNDAVDLVGGLSGEQLEAYWQAADVYVSASKHEGFCAPLVEAMGHDVPVVARSAAAVPETVGSAALLLEDDSALSFAASVDRVLEDESLRRFLVDQGRIRTNFFDLGPASTRFFEALAPILR